MTNIAALQFVIREEFKNFGPEFSGEESAPPSSTRLRTFSQKYFTPQWTCGTLAVFATLFAPFLDSDGRFSWHFLADYDYHWQHKGSEDILILEWGMIAILGFWWWMRRREAVGRNNATPLATFALLIIACLIPPMKETLYDFVWSGKVIYASGLFSELFLIMLAGFALDYYQSKKQQPAGK